ncbi:MAG: NADH-quinone oxidoreductase subunit M [Planctomycetota bacterium]|nr:NADH-quinone oxidoreductase subunit M [Planctomycetota bacterium]
MDNFLLPLLLIIPTLGAVVCALLPNAKAARLWALVVSLATAAVAGVLAFQFDWAAGNARVVYGGGDMALMQVSTINFGFKLAMDAVSLWLVLLTVLLMPLAVAASFDSIKERQKEYYAWMLVLLTAMLGVFVARDLLLFYVFFELTLIPMFFIIGIWGGAQRREAAGKFFLFTFAGSVFTLAGVVYIGLRVNSFDLDLVMRAVRGGVFNDAERFWLFLAFLAGFAVKVPLFPVHTWLPLAHTEAPTAGSVILAGVLLKLGTYGLYKLAIPIGLLAPGTNTPAFPTMLKVLGVLCLIGIVYGALVAWVQQDIKKLVAYSSVSHLGFCVLGLLALNDEGVGGSVLYMINHGLSTGALFLVIGMIYDRYHTRDIDQLSGLAKRMPVMAFFFILFTLSSIGLPGLNGFVSEFLTILGAFTSDHLGRTYGVIAATGIVLGAIYMLHMAARVIWGPLKTPAAHAGHGSTALTASGDSHHDPERVKRGANADLAADAPGAQQPDAMTRHDAPTVKPPMSSAVPHTEPPTPSAALHGGQADVGQGASPDHTHGDLNGREIAILMPLAVLVVVLGLFPNLVLKTIEPSIQQHITRADRAPKPATPQAGPLVAVSD